MENRIENLLRMFHAVWQYLKQNPAAWPENYPLGATLEEMVVRVDRVESTRQMGRAIVLRIKEAKECHTMQSYGRGDIG